MSLRQPGIPDNSKITALYSRLSVDDDCVNESGSIVNQKKMLEDYAAKNGFTNPIHFSDDGYSGKNFDRPDWKRLIAEIEKGNVGVILAKDMSRVGRDYLQTGFYTEVFFREKGVRFIAVENNIDSTKRESVEFAPFLNIMNEMYLRDASRKVKSVMKSRGMSGKRLTFNPIYGYIINPNNKDEWIPDPEAASIVSRIFRLTIEGKGPSDIARILANDKIERPSYYQSVRGIINRQQYDNSNPYAWSCNTVKRIIERPEYMGNTVNFRSYKDSYKDKRAKDTPKEDWVIFENTHPAIIDSETWETAQRCRKTVRRTDSLGEANPLTGLVFCADCGAKLYNHRKPYPTSYINKAGYNCTRSPRDVYACSTYSLTSRRFDRTCTAHHISTKVLRELVLEIIKNVSGFVRQSEAEFIRLVREASVIQQEAAAKTQRRQLAKNQKRHAELNTVISKLFEQNATGKITDSRFETLLAGYEKEQAELAEDIAKLQTELDGFDADSVRADKFIEIVEKYTDFTELTTPMIHEFVEKIVVHEAEKIDGERTQQVDIYLNFIGKFDAPAPEPTQEEIETEEKARRRRAQRREAQRRYAERQKQNEQLLNTI